jgi:hypothetical protein
MDVVGLEERGHFLDPGDEFFVVGVTMTECVVGHTVDSLRGRLLIIGARSFQ